MRSDKPYVSSSYYISTQDNEASGDEAIIDFQADIVAITPEMPIHVGQIISCSLMCSRAYRASDDSCTLGRPLLLYVTLRRDRRLFSAYLPSDVFWVLQTDLKSGRLRNVEIRFEKPRYGVRPSSRVCIFRKLLTEMSNWLRLAHIWISMQNVTCGG
jgi:hypothetical protein